MLQRFVESYVVDIKFDVDAVIDGTVHHFEHVLDIIVKNTKIFGGEWIFDPRSESDDGRFELVPVTGRRDFGTKLLGSLRRSPVGVDDLQLLGFSHAPGDQRRAVRAHAAQRDPAGGAVRRRGAAGGRALPDRGRAARAAADRPARSRRPGNVTSFLIFLEDHDG